MGKWIIKFTAIATDIEDTEINSKVEKISDQIDKLLNSNKDVDISLLITGFEKIHHESNAGRCVKCGTWVTDYDKPYRIPCTTDGVEVDGKWFCEVCISKDNYKSVWYEGDSNYKPQITVPDFVGVSLEDIIDSGYQGIFKFVFDTADSHVFRSHDLICKQSLEAGTDAASGSMITLTVCPWSREIARRPDYQIKY